MRDSKVGILLVTHNSQEKLNVIVNSLLCDFIDAEIVIADSSIKSWEAGFSENIRYFHCPKLSLIEKIHIFSEKINSEFLLLHPDGEILNPYAFEYLTGQLKVQNRFISSSVSQNITRLQKTGNERSVFLPRNYRAFAEHARYCLDSDEKLEKSLSPYHQMIWGLHNKRVLRDFFSVAVTVPWDIDSYTHVTLFERIFNIFMHFHGEVIVSTLPLFMREQAQRADRKTMMIEGFSIWMKNFSNGSKEHQKFFDLLCNKFQNEFGDYQASVLLKSIFENEAVWRQSVEKRKNIISRIGMRLLKFLKLQKTVEFHRLIRLSPAFSIEVTSQKDFMSQTEFDIFFANIHSFVTKKHEYIKNF